LIEAAAEGHQDPLWRAVIICIGAEAKASMVREAGAVYARLSAVYAAEFSSEWLFQSSGAIVRIADGLHEARCSTGWDMICLDHIEEFRASERLEVPRLLRRVPGRHPRIRATARVDRDWRRQFPARITFDGEDAGDLDVEPNPEATDLERLVHALTRYQDTSSDDEWARAVDAARLVAPGKHDAETSALIKIVDAKDGDEKRLRAALERARHHLAELQGAPAGSCHRTCRAGCSLRLAP
jgi:hypothetical protein